MIPTTYLIPLLLSAPRPLSPGELAETKGGVGTTVNFPSANTAHYDQNPQIDADVFNYQNQTTTWLYLHHGTSKTGARSIPTPAPGYSGQLLSRFMLRGNVNDDLVIKYYDTEDQMLAVSRQVADQRLHSTVKLFKVVVHNVKTTTNQTNVSRNVVAKAVDSQTYNQGLSVSDSVDAILAQCAAAERVQMTIDGQDSTGTLHQIVTGTNNCAALEDHIETDGQDGDPILDATATACMNELFNASIAMDPLHENIHVFIVKDLPNGLNGFSDVTAQGAVIRESEFAGASWWVASLMLHEIAHGFGLGHLASAAPECGGLPHQRRLMCPGAQAGKLLSAAECTSIDNASYPKDYN